MGYKRQYSLVFVVCVYDIISFSRAEYQILMDQVMTLQWIYFGIIILILPPLVLGILRKTKARLQNRIGASVIQPFMIFINCFVREKRLVISPAGYSVVRQQ